MGTIRKRIGKKSVSWIAEVCINSQRNSKTFNTRKQAVTWINNQETKGIIKKHTMHEAFERYIPYLEELRGRQPALSRLNSLKSKIPDIPLEDFNFTFYNNWKSIRRTEIGPNSFNREAGVLSKILRLCVTQWGWLHSHPIPDIGRLKDNPPRRRGISQVEINHILMKLSKNKHGQQLSILFLLALETGMRLGEMLSIKWINVHEKFVHLEMTKNGEPRDVPLSEVGRILIKRRIGFNEDFVFDISPQNASKNFARCSPQDIHFHDTRSEAITRLSKKLTLLELAFMVGHKDLRSLQIYYKGNIERIADVISL